MTENAHRSAVGDPVATDRLKGVPVSEEHLPEYLRLLGDEQVMQSVSPDGRPYAEARIRVIHEQDMWNWSQDGFGFWVWWEKDSGAFVGRGGLRRIDLEGKPVVEISLALTPEFWNLGFATEIAALSRDIAFKQHGLESVMALTLVHNSASRWVMEKVGMCHERDVTREGVPHALYRVDRPQ